jgi:hypothetical protein
MLAVRVLAQIPEDPTWVQTWAQIREEMSLGQTPAPNLVQILAHSRLEQKSAQLLMLANLSLGQTPVLALVQMLADSRLVQTSAQLQMLAKPSLGQTLVLELVQTLADSRLVQTSAQLQMLAKLNLGQTPVLALTLKNCFPNQPPLQPTMILGLPDPVHQTSAA